MTITRIKNQMLDLINNTTDLCVLTNSLKVLEHGDIRNRALNVLKTNPTAAAFADQIANTIISIDVPVIEKNDFLNRYPRGVLDVSLLLDKNPHTFRELVGSGFSAILYKELCISLVSQGVGPGEVAIAAMNPTIRWNGQVPGGGDIVVGGICVEVKTKIKSGGRWLNTRKANMNMPAIKHAIEGQSGSSIPDRLSISDWIYIYRPKIPTTNLPDVCKTIATGLFTATDTNAFETALVTGDKETILDELLRAGYNNYKTLSKFDGILMIDVPKEKAQYFTTYEEMKGKIKVECAYLYAPESEAMPKVSLSIPNWQPKHLLFTACLYNINL